MLEDVRPLAGLAQEFRMDEFVKQSRELFCVSTGDQLEQVESEVTAERSDGRDLSDFLCLPECIEAGFERVAERARNRLRLLRLAVEDHLQGLLDEEGHTLSPCDDVCQNRARQLPPAQNG